MADTINARFRALRKRLDLTIAQMADVLGLHIGDRVCTA